MRESRHRQRAALVASALVAAVVATPGAGGQPGVVRTRPKLVAVLVVDQFRADYIERYGHEWTGGLRRLLDGGAWFSHADYPYYNTVTCVGHSTIGTGAYPSTHGMVLNEWWDRQSGGRTACTSDAATSLVSFGPALTGRGESAKNLAVPTLADEMRAQLGGGSRVMTFSLKARSAIGLAGHGGTVVWFDRGTFVTSSAFAEAPVPAISEFVGHHPVDADAGRTWERMLPVDRYLFESPAIGAKPSATMTATFPHVLAAPGDANARSFSSQWQRSPFADAYLGRMALHAARALGAGSGDGTDFLGVSFSTLDYVGHNFGPRSHEVQDVLLQLDRTIGVLLDGLDQLVGADNYVVALSSDHGVAPIPEYASSVGLDAGRRSSAAVTEAVEEALAPLGAGTHVATTLYTDVYLTEGTWAKLRERPDLIRAVKARVESLEGVDQVFTRDDIATGVFADGSAGDRMARGYFAGRSGDLLVAPRPYWIATSDGTTHGTGYAYDARVPLVLMGPGIAPGEYVGRATPADLAPTLAHLLGVTLPHAQGRVLGEALTGIKSSPAGRSGPVDQSANRK